MDARRESGRLKVVSTEFEKLTLPLANIPALKRASPDELENFQLDEDGAFIYWPALDVHLGWPQLSSIAFPERAFRAQQRSAAFNQRFGNALRCLREKAKLTQSQIRGLSERQVQRIEQGQCRVTSRAIASHAKAHGMSVDIFLEKVAAILNPGSNPELDEIHLLKKGFG